MKKFVLGLEIFKIHHKLVRTIETTAIEALGQSITTTTARILCYVVEANETQEIYQKNIEAFMHLKRSSISIMLNSMEENGYITREQVVHDGRLNKIVPTKLAIEVHKKLVRELDRIENQMMQHLSEDEKETLSGLLDKVNQGI